MNLPNLVPYTKYILLGCALFLGACMLRACYFAGQVKQQLEVSPPLPKKEVKLIVAAKKKAEVEAKKAKQEAKHFEARADSSRKVAVRAEKKIDSLQARYEAVPPVATVPFADVQRYFNTYQSPDTLR